MKKPALVIALAIVVVSNAFVLVHAWTNRRGTPDAEVALTQRELPVISNWTETTGVVLMVQWRHGYSDYRSPESGDAWFDEQKLRDLGFDLTLPADAPDARRRYANQPPRQVYVALEYDGPAWERWWASYAASQANAPPGTPVTPDAQVRTMQNSMSRLMEIDVGLDPAALRQAHPNRQQVIILGARARAMVATLESLTPGQPGRPVLRGEITDVSTDRLVVPSSLSDVFVSKPSTYVVTLAVGSKYEPWITTVTK